MTQHHQHHRPRRPIYYDEKVFGPLSLMWVVRILLLLAILTVAVFTLQLVQINNAAHSREELRDSVCTLIATAAAEVRNDPRIIRLARKDGCPLPIPVASATK